jgi:hypothetical protein
MFDFFQQRDRPVLRLKPRLEVVMRSRPGELTVYQIDIEESAETPHRFGAPAE